MSAMHPADMTVQATSEAHWLRVQKQRIREGRCADCGAFWGPTHRCPSINPATSNTQKEI